MAFSIHRLISVRPHRNNRHPGVRHRLLGLWAASSPDASPTPRSALPSRRFSRAAARVPATVWGRRPRTPRPPQPLPGPVLGAQSHRFLKSSPRGPPPGGRLCGFSTPTPSSGTLPDPLPANYLLYSVVNFSLVFTSQRVISGLRRTLSLTGKEPKSHVPVSARGIGPYRPAVAPGRCSFGTESCQAWC